MGLIADRIENLRVEMEAIARRTGRSAAAVRLVAVSKTVPPERIREAYAAGVRDFAENKVQDYLDKKDLLPADCRWHFIGRLQTNKVKPLLAACARGQLALVHSLDRLELVHEIAKQAGRLGEKTVDALLQVNTAEEISKGGFKVDEVRSALGAINACSAIKIRGLMTIGPLTDDRERVRAAFRRLRELKESLQQDFPANDWGILSMGMSGDYALAIEEGSTLVRIGSAIFGPRKEQA